MEDEKNHIPGDHRGGNDKRRQETETIVLR